jgi:nicotinamidase-related amidase
VIDKSVYSAFSRPLLPKLLRRGGIDSLIITGGETDGCVLATVLDAVDLGYRTVIARDALCSSSDAAHDALLTLYHHRFSQQIEAAHSETILAPWL